MAGWKQLCMFMVPLPNSLYSFVRGPEEMEVVWRSWAQVLSRRRRLIFHFGGQLKHDLSLVCGVLLPNYCPFPEGCGWYSGCQAQKLRHPDAGPVLVFQKGLTDPFPGPWSPTEGASLCV